MARCGRTPYLRVYDVPADPDTAAILLPQRLVAFVIRPRTAVGMKLRLDPSAADYFSIDAGESLAADELNLEAAGEDVTVHLSGASALTVELFGWLD